MHNRVLFAAERAPKVSAISPFRLEDNGVYILLVADVWKFGVDKVGEVWIGGDMDQIIGYTLPGLEEGEPAGEDAMLGTLTDDEKDTLSCNSIIDRIVKVAAAVRKAAEHKLTLTGFVLGTHGEHSIYYFTINGRPGLYQTNGVGEVAGPDGVYGDIRYPDGTDLQADLATLVAKFRASWRDQWNNSGIRDLLDQATTVSIAAANNEPAASLVTEADATSAERRVFEAVQGEAD